MVWNVLAAAAAASPHETPAAAFVEEEEEEGEEEESWGLRCLLRCPSIDPFVRSVCPIHFSICLSDPFVDPFVDPSF